jgi:tetrahydromethanopterin S-methyltransferase subunit F
MKLKNSIGLFVGVLFIFLLCIFLPACTASSSKLSIKNVSVQLVETRDIAGNRTIHVYNIFAILYNSGDMISEEINVYFYDPEFNKTTPPLTLNPLNVSLDPNENMTFVLENWPTPLSGDIPINISFGPSSPNVLETDKNHGHYIYTLHIGNSNTTTSTPGFEIGIVFCAILVLFVWRNRKK